MPEHLRAYIVITIIALASFSLIKKFALNHMALKDFNSYRTAWLVSTSIAFLSHNFWIAVLLLLFYSITLSKKFSEKVLVFVLLLFISPPITKHIGGIGFDHLLQVDFIRVVSVAVLLPLFIKLIQSKNKLKFGKSKTDIFVILYFIVALYGDSRSTTGTDLIRYGIYTFTDHFLPYYVISRSIKNIKQLNAVLVTFFIAVLISSNIGIFENLKGWILYSQLGGALNAENVGGYTARGSELRAVSSFAKPIIFGYMVTICVGIFLYLKTKVKNKSQKRVILLMLFIGLYAPISRGPWVGALGAYVCFILLNKNSIKGLFKLSTIALVVFMIVLASPYRDKAINLIPFVGKTESYNVEYRQHLFDVSLNVIAKNPLMGSPKFKEEPEMAVMYQGEGIIDVVNSYILVALKYGLIGLLFYSLTFISTILSLLRSMSAVKAESESLFILGASLISILASIMLMIATASPIMTIPIVNFMFLGISVAYSKVVADFLKEGVGRKPLHQSS